MVTSKVDTMSATTEHIKTAKEWQYKESVCCQSRNWTGCNLFVIIRQLTVINQPTLQICGSLHTQKFTISTLSQSPVRISEIWKINSEIPKKNSDVVAAGPSFVSDSSLGVTCGLESTGNNRFFLVASRFSSYFTVQWMNHSWDPRHIMQSSSCAYVHPTCSMYISWYKSKVGRKPLSYEPGCGHWLVQ